MEKYKLAELKKLTAVKLREIAVTFEEITGASGMNKEQLVENVAQALKKRDLFVEEELHSSELDDMEKKRLKLKPELKKLIKQKRDILAQEEHDLEKLHDVRAQLKRLRRKIHRTRLREAQLKKLMKIKS